MKNSRNTFLITFTALTLAAQAAWGATLTANNSNDDCADGTGGLQQCLDIAVDNAEPDTIKLEPGTYNGDFVYNAAITAEDAPLVIENASEAKPKIVGGMDSSLNLISSPFGDDSSGFTLRGLVFEDGNGGNGGGLRAGIDNADFTVENCEFIGNKATLGAALSIMTGDIGDGNVTIRDSKFLGNEAESVGGAVQIVIENGDITLEGNTFQKNSAGIFDGGAGILKTVGGTIRLERNIVESNFAKSSGGGFELDTENGTVIVNGNLFSENHAAESGGAVSVVADEPAAKVVMTNNVMSKNHSGNDEQGPGLDDDANGGAINVVFYSDESSLTLTHNTVVDNSSQDKGGAVAVSMDFANNEARFYNNIFQGNASANEGADLYANEDEKGGDNPASVEWFNNLYSEIASQCEIDGGDCVSEGANLIGQDPLFVNAAAGDFSLNETSPAVDQGSVDAPELPATDFLGQARPAKSDTNPDMGALEFQPAPVEAPPADDQNPDAANAQGGCSMGAATGGSFAQLAWVLLGIAGLIVRKKSR